MNNLDGNLIERFKAHLHGDELCLCFLNSFILSSLLVGNIDVPLFVLLHIIWGK